MKNIFWKCLTLLLLMHSASAFAEEWPGFRLRTHEFALSGAFYPGMYVWGYDFAQDGYVLAPGDDGTYVSMSDMYESTEAYNKERVTGSWGLTYTYNFTEIWAIQAGFHYEGCWNEYYSREDDSLLVSAYGNFFTLMATARASWLNRRIVRVYSSVGMGAALGVINGEYSLLEGEMIKTPVKWRIAYQFNPIGITLGTKFFAFAECGFGSVFAGVRGGFGYRF